MCAGQAPAQRPGSGRRNGRRCGGPTHGAGVDTVGELGNSGERLGMGLRDLVYRLYERRLEASLSGHSIPASLATRTRSQTRVS